MEEESNGVQLVTLYTRVLLELARNPRISQEMLARRLDVTMRTAQRHLTELEQEGYIGVDRNAKPFRYTINWTKPVPHVPWLRVIIFHPEVTDALRRLSDVAAQTYDGAGAKGSDTTEALRQLFAEPAANIPVS